MNLNYLPVILITFHAFNCPQMWKMIDFAFTMVIKDDPRNCCEKKFRLLISNNLACLNYMFLFILFRMYEGKCGKKKKSFDFYVSQQNQVVD